MLLIQILWWICVNLTLKTKRLLDFLWLKSKMMWQHVITWRAKDVVQSVLQIQNKWKWFPYIVYSQCICNNIVLWLQIETEVETFNYPYVLLTFSFFSLTVWCPQSHKQDLHICWKWKKDGSHQKALFLATSNIQ